jgi:hypothetical protein
VWEAVHTEITGLLTEHGLHHIAVIRAAEGPQRTAGGKYRAVIPLD